MRLIVHHTTTYSYSEPTRRVVQLLRVTPQSFSGQNVLDWRIDVDADARLRERQDSYGNIVHMLYIDRPLTTLSVSVSGEVLTENGAGIMHGLPETLPDELFLRATPLTQPGETLGALAAEVERAGPAALDRMHRLMTLLHGRLRFDVEATAVGTRAEEAHAAGHGVCQDFAHIFIAVARRLGIPARYVSGHLFRRDGAHLQEASHAWAEAAIEHLGWVGFDPANGICVDDSYVRVACGLDYQDAAPVAGARSGGGTEALAVEVQVHDARVQAQTQRQS